MDEKISKFLGIKNAIKPQRREEDMVYRFLENHVIIEVTEVDEHKMVNFDEELERKAKYFLREKHHKLYIFTISQKVDLEKGKY